MKRRDFITLVGGAAAAWPLAGRAQQPDRMRRIGVLMAFAESDPEGQAWFAAFREGLQKLAWAEGRNIRIDTRWTIEIRTTKRCPKGHRFEQKSKRTVLGVV
jgi:putative tryptophan/tyrosine transport system substrate-binding protein